MSFNDFVLPSGVRRMVQLAVLALVAVSLLAVGFGAPANAAPIPAAKVAGAPTLKLGSKSAAVTYLQKRLKVRATGSFNAKTRSAVVRYEKAHKLPTDGVVKGNDWRWIGVPPGTKKLSARAVVPGSAAFGSKVMAIASKYRGAPYRHGGNGPAYDCSGFVKKVFGQLGYGLPRTAAGMRSVTPRVSKSNLKVGDLVFVYNGGGGRVGHVAIYAGKGYWYEASQPGTPLGKHRAWSSRVSYGRVA